MARVKVRPAAQRDLVQHFAYMGENGSLELALRFRDSARLTFSELARHPRMGAPGKLLKFPDLRMWRIRGFEKCLIFYHPSGDDIVIERVVHAAHDYNRILESH